MFKIELHKFLHISRLFLFSLFLQTFLTPLFLTRYTKCILHILKQEGAESKEDKKNGSERNKGSALHETIIL
jgi:hypothetical protein